jgi:hypothetical protein
MAEQRSGRRRLDRVLAAGFLEGLGTRQLDEVRGLRADAEQEEADLSYIRRLLQGRIDIVRAEAARRESGGSESLISSLPQILSEDRSPARGSGRHVTVEPSRVDEHRRTVEALVADVGISDVGERSDAELAAALEVLVAEERTISEQRHTVQQVMDACTAEITRRYREGEAEVDGLLSSEA